MSSSTEGIIYNPVTGQILRQVVCPDPAEQLQPGEALLLHPGVDDRYYYVDTATQQVVPIPAAPSEAHEFNYTTKSWDVDIGDARALAWSKAKERRAATLENGFTWNGYVFDSDPTSQQLIQGAVLSAQVAASEGAAFSKTWTLADNTNVTIDGPTMILIGKAMDAHVEKCYVAGQLARQQINDALTATDAMSVDYDTVFNSL